MSTEFDVTVITASFNLLKNGRKERIIKCLETVHAQTGCKLEHLIIDGASTDGTLEFFKPYEEQGWIKVYSEPDKGIYDAFNKGVSKARGKYVCFINSDDFFNNNTGLSSAVSILKQSGADFSYSPVSFEKDGKIVGTDEKRQDFRNIFVHMAVCHQGMLFKKELFDKVGLHNIKYIISADYDFVLRCLLNKASFVKAPQPYAVFSLNGLSGNNPQQILRESAEIKAERYHCSLAEAEKIQQTKFIPWKLLKNLLAQTSIKNTGSYFRKNFAHWLDLAAHKILTLRTRKGRRKFVFLGITVYQEQK